MTGTATVHEFQQEARAFVSIERFAWITGLSARQVSRMLTSGELPSLKIGRRRLIPVGRALAALERLGT
jgi:excisionase family DNA binding protein